MKNEENIEDLVRKLQELQLQQNALIEEIQRRTESDTTETKPTVKAAIKSAEETEADELCIDDWVRIKNTYRGDKGLTGQVVKITNNSVHIITSKGPRTKRIHNVAKITRPRNG